MPRKRTTYDREFKLKAVALSFEREESAHDVAKELGISPKLLYKWRGQLGKEKNKSFPGHGKQLLSKEEKKIAELEKRLRETNLERDILKKAISIFSRNDGKSFDL
jgi:transposase